MKTTESSEERWALMHKEGFLLGKYCWPDALSNEPMIPTFRTRKQARHAREFLKDYCSKSRPVKIRVEYCV